MADAVSPSASAPPLRKTALHAAHVALGARMVPFGGWDMPVEYSGITAEHLAVRERVGLFDVSHMGEIEIAGADALAAVQKLTSNDASRLAVGQIQYSSLPTPEGTVVDDVLVYRWAPEHFLLVVNAGNIEKDWALDSGAHRRRRRRRRRELQLALRADRHPGPQGGSGAAAADRREPRRPQVLLVRARRVRGHPRHRLAHRLHRRGRLRDLLRARPGRTRCGRRSSTPASPRASSRPASARGTRCASKPSMRLCGSDMDETTTLLEAGLGWIVGWKKADFIGKAALEAQKAAGVTKRIVGFEMVDRGIARAGCPVIVDGVEAGKVTSGTQTPFLKKRHRHGLRPGGGVAARAGLRHRHPRPPRGRRGRADAVLQADHVGSTDVSGGPEVHQGPRVGPQRRRRRPPSASPITRRPSSATSCSSSCRRSAAPSSRARSSAPSSR